MIHMGLWIPKNLPVSPVWMRTDRQHSRQVDSDSMGAMYSTGSEVRGYTPLGQQSEGLILRSLSSTSNQVSEGSDVCWTWTSCYILASEGGFAIIYDTNDCLRRLKF